MIHGRKYRRLNFYSGKRQSYLRNMAISLIKSESIVTTTARAKEVKRHTEKIITLCKDESLSSKKKAYSYLRDKEVVEKLFTTLKDRYANRAGGYVRIFNVGYRKGDGAEMSLLKLT
ncbi:MAG TPA: 50S ribosomal protein L17 [Caldisericia bacterium]|jgi:large subunit ribosomal protein L17|nr:50S ribosomal protein L17 [Caldisericia bacterium]HOJ16118.1 50S ribosomal protein L17 [Caldisericia bacterium]HOW02769.1 50S ribosomal protein L17 [Caldisericia bacterium]HPO28697.1 50S ribosomal protein L17 [Caldisericia bacterium]HQG82241.1 50S ribosomal protein L17 [Caldisericia bacterium]